LPNVGAAAPEDVQQLWIWNKAAPEAIGRFVHEMVQERAMLQPNAPASCAWDGDLIYGELDKLSTKLAGNLVELGVEPEVLVPLCFEKTIWTAVAILGVLKAGGGFTLLDLSLPEQRLEAIVELVKGRNLIVSSASNQALSSRLGRAAITVYPTLFASLGDDLYHSGYIRAPNNEFVAYVNFTTGSTGTPKGVIITQQNDSSALHHQMDRSGFNGANSTRRIALTRPFRSYFQCWSQARVYACLIMMIVNGA
jgi:non-ribosomal peptide synthetase component F